VDCCSPGRVPATPYEASLTEASAANPSFSTSFQSERIGVLFWQKEKRDLKIKMQQSGGLLLAGQGPGDTLRSFPHGSFGSKSLLLRQIRTILGYDTVFQYGSFFIDFMDILKYNIHTD